MSGAAGVDALSGFFIYLSFMIKPQPGFQEMALSSPADIAIMGGSAGCGKTFTLLMEPTRHFRNPKFSGIIFRRTTPQIKNPGGLWETSAELYRMLGGEPREGDHKWVFPGGSAMRFTHLQYEDTKTDWQGSQIPFIGFDELTHFSEGQFFYMLSRNRSSSGVRPYIRATCNPDPDSWVARFISWWINQDTGFPIPERAGVLRWFTRDGEAMVWGDSYEEVIAKCPHIFDHPALKESGTKMSDLIKSVTFIPGSIFENKIFIKQDPGYLGSLLALPEDEKARLLDGNWKIRLDGMGLCDYAKLKDIFTNHPTEIKAPLRCITVDAARFGRDYCVLFVWQGWRVIHTTVFKKSDVHDVVKHIEELRRKFNVMKSNVVVDQDGVGGGTVKIGDYRGFRGGLPIIRDPDTRIKEFYSNLKTQCYYRLCELRINQGEIRLDITQENCRIYDDSGIAGYYSTKIKTKNGVRDIKDLILEDLRSVKRAVRLDDKEPLKIIPKDEQKNILGRSPDFSDTLMMREYLELKSPRKNFTEDNN